MHSKEEKQVNNRIQLNELMEILDRLTPEEVVAQYGDRLDAESQQLLSEFPSFNKDLDGLHREMSLLAPEVPQVNAPVKNNVIPMRRRWQLPAWSLPLTAAATFTLGLLVPRDVDPIQAPATDTSQVSELGTTRTLQIDQGPMLNKNQARFNLDIASSYFERGAFFYELDSEDGYRRAMQDFKMAYKLNTKDARVLDYLIITAEELGDSEAKSYYEGLRTELSEDQ
jgi:hypothetical protein